MISKKQLIMVYLELNLFIPILYAPQTSPQLKLDFEHTRARFSEFSAEGILNYVWNILANHEVKMIFSNRLMDEGFYNYEQILDDFKHKFTYDWLMS